MSDKEQNDNNYDDDDEVVEEEENEEEERRITKTPRKQLPSKKFKNLKKDKSRFRLHKSINTL